MWGMDSPGRSCMVAKVHHTPTRCMAARSVRSVDRARPRPLSGDTHLRLGACGAASQLLPYSGSVLVGALWRRTLGYELWVCNPLCFWNRHSLQGSGRVADLFLCALVSGLRRDDAVLGTYAARPAAWRFNHVGPKCCRLYLDRLGALCDLGCRSWKAPAPFLTASSARRRQRRLVMMHLSANASQPLFYAESFSPNRGPVR